jgi:hypothetical protein
MYAIGCRPKVHCMVLHVGSGCLSWQGSGMAGCKWPWPNVCSDCRRVTQVAAAVRPRELAVAEGCAAGTEGVNVCVVSRCAATRVQTNSTSDLRHAPYTMWTVLVRGTSLVFQPDVWVIDSEGCAIQLSGLHLNEGHARVCVCCGSCQACVWGALDECKTTPTRWMDAIAC